jgi:hypothetical protein
MTIAVERSETLQALVDRADRARAQALANAAAYERAMSRTREFDIRTDSRLIRQGDGELVDAYEARIRQLEDTVEGLTKRLESQGPIEQAKGIIMAQTRCDPDQAFEILRRASQRSNTKLRLLASELVARTSTKAEAARNH